RPASPTSPPSPTASAPSASSTPSWRATAARPGSTSDSPPPFMQIGFLTACLPQVPLEKIVPWAAAQGFEALELAAWPYDSTRDYQASHIRAEAFTRDDAARVRDLFAMHGLRISAMAYYDNNLHPDRQQREAHLAHVRKVID